MADSHDPGTGFQKDPLRCFQGTGWRWGWTCLLAVSLAAGLTQRVRADHDDDKDHHHHHHHDVHVHIPGIRVDVEHDPFLLAPPAAGPVVAAPAAVPVPAAPAVPVPAVPAVPTAERETTTSVVVETRGPVHEAFAEPVVFDPTPGITVPKDPPPAIDEVPPDEAPEGDNVQWIPGYWAWDDERNDFIWTSGIWRNMPPGRQFVPGYWAEAQDGSGAQWVSGFWQSDRIETVQYLPDPPESQEAGPVGEPPQPNYVWVPGVWLWRQADYVWRPGYWMAPQDNWVWVPAHYTWAPGGYVFVSGYWDYAPERRGLLFAPVYVPPALVVQRTFTYTPSVVLNSALLVGHLFARPKYDHYYFGDYYSRAYFRQGIYPAYSFHDSRYGYDPLFASYVARQGGKRDIIIQRLRQDYRFRLDHPEARPPRTFAALRQMEARGQFNAGQRSQLAIAQPLNQFVRQGNLPLKFQRIQPDRVNTYRQTIAQARQYQDQRKRLETQRLAAGTPIGPNNQQRNLNVPNNNQPRIIGTPIGPTNQQRQVTPPTPPQPEPRAGRLPLTPPGQLQTPPGQVQTPPGQLKQQQVVPPTGARPVTPNPDAKRLQQQQIGAGTKGTTGQQQQQYQARRLQLQRSPFAGPPMNKLNKSYAPPPPPRGGKPDTNVKPGTRIQNRREPQE